MNKFYKFTIRIIFTLIITIITSQNSIAYADNIKPNDKLIIYKFYFSILSSIDSSIDKMNHKLNKIEENSEANITDNDVESNKELIDKVENFEKTRVITTDIHKPSGLTPEEYNKLIDYTLKSNGNYDNSKLIGLGHHLYKTEQDNQNINGLFILSIMSEESGWGTSNPAINHNNLGGIMKSYSGGQKIRTFSSCGECVLFMGNLLSKNYIDKGLIDVMSVGKKYCPPSYDEWANSVDYILNIYNDNINYIINNI